MKIFYRLPQVMEVTGGKESTIYYWIAKGDFPKPYKLGARSVGWCSEEIDEWVKSRRSC